MTIKIPDNDSKRRSSVLQTLNEKFGDLIRNFKISEAYDKIVISKPFKVLSSFVYDWTFAPLKRGGMEVPISPKPKSTMKKGRTSGKKSVSISQGRSPVSSSSQSNLSSCADTEFEHPSHR